MHRRMAGRESERLRVLADVCQPDGARLVDQKPEHTAAVRQVTDLLSHVLVETDGDEVRKPALTGREHAQRGVLRVGDVRRGVHDLLEHLVEVELRADRDDSGQQALQAIGERGNSLDPLDDLVQQRTQA